MDASTEEGHLYINPIIQFIWHLDIFSRLANKKINHFLSTHFTNIRFDGFLYLSLHDTCLILFYFILLESILAFRQSIKTGAQFCNDAIVFPLTFIGISKEEIQMAINYISA